MEHRHAYRETVEIDVLLSTPDRVTRQARIKDLSTTGACVVVASGALERGLVVEVSMPLSKSAPRSQRPRSRGYVVRAQANEFGLIWLTESAVSSLLSFKHDHVEDSLQEREESVG